MKGEYPAHEATGKRRGFISEVFPGRFTLALEAAEDGLLWPVLPFDATDSNDALKQAELALRIDGRQHVRVSPAGSAASRAVLVEFWNLDEGT